MARYFFHLHECGDTTFDEEGTDHLDLEAVRSAAVLAARDIMAGEVLHGRLCLSCHVEVQDEEGCSVLTLPFNEALVVTGG